MNELDNQSCVKNEILRMQFRYLCLSTFCNTWFPIFLTMQKYLNKTFFFLICISIVLSMSIFNYIWIEENSQLKYCFVTYYIIKLLYFYIQIYIYNYILLFINLYEPLKLTYKLSTSYDFLEWEIHQNI